MRMDQNLHASVMENAKRAGLSMNEYIINQLEYALGTDVRYVRSKFWFDDDGMMQAEFWVPEDLEERLRALQDR